MAPFIWVAADLRTILALHPSLQLVNGGGLWPAQDCEINRAVRFASEAFHLEEAHPSIQDISFLTRLLGPLKPVHGLVRHRSAIFCRIRSLLDFTCC